VSVLSIVEWIVWGLACGWAVVAFVSFLVDVFRPDPLIQPMDVYLFPYSLDSYLSTNEKRLISSLYITGITAALTVTAIWDISKLHLLWFLPIFHFFGTQWAVLLSHYFQENAKSKQIVSENGDENIKQLKIRDVVAQKYSIIIMPSSNSALLIHDLDLTVEMLIEEHNKIKKETIDIGVNLARSVDVLTRMKKISSISMLLSIWPLYFIISIILFFISWTLGVAFSLFAVFGLLYTKALYAEIRRLVLTDYEAFYVLSGTDSIAIRET